MIRHLSIQSIATIDSLELDFDSGLTVFTGETGAGKSILIDSILLLFGKSVSEDVIREGAETAYIEGIFALDDVELPEELNDYLEPGEDLILSRHIFRGKRPVSKINGRSVTVKMLKLLAPRILTVSGQHDHMQLLNSSIQARLLDGFCNDDLKDSMERYRTEYQHYQQVLKQYNEIVESADRKDQEEDFLKFQIQDISSQKFKANEDFDLQDIRANYKRLHRQKNALRSAQSAAYECAEKQRELKSSFADMSEGISDYDTLAEKLDMAMETVAQIQDRITEEEIAMGNLASVSIDEVEARLDCIFKYKSKYKVLTIDALIALESSLKSQLQALENSDARIQELKDAVSSSEKRLAKHAEALHDIRRRSSTILSKRVEDQLKPLAFTHVVFQINVRHTPGVFSPHGSDEVIFEVALNKGMSPRPLQDIVSGGELSRITLAIRSVLHSTFRTPILIFDEIDTGLGGHTATAIGDALFNLSQYSQLLCITHLAQIASFAHQHIYVSKSEIEGATITVPKLLSKDETTAELKRMVGGDDVVKLIDQGQSR